MASKSRGGLSKREFAAKQQGGVLDYKSGKITKPAPKIAAPTKKVTYDAKNGRAVVSTEPTKKAIGQRTDGSLIYEGEESRPVYGPAIPQGFKQQVSAVKNYSQNINYSPAKPSKEEVIRKSREEADRYKKEASTGSIVKNTLKGIKDVFMPGRGYSDEEINKAKPTFKESVTGGLKSAGEIANLIPKAGGFLAKGVAKVAEKAGAKTYAQKVRDIVDKYNEKSDKKLAPKTAGEAKVMRASDVLTTFVGGSTTKAGRVTKTLAQASKNAVKKAGKETAEAAVDGFTRVGKAIGKDAEIRAAGNAAIGKQVSTAGKTVARTAKESVTVPRARAASFADETFTSAEKRSSSIADDIPDNIKNEKPRGTAPRRDEPFQAPEKAPIERTRVAKLKESETALRAKIAKSIDDANNAPDVIDEATGKLKPKKDPTAEIEGHISEFRKEFEDLTGEKAPADPDEMLARLKSIERENEGAWRKQDKRWTREKDLRSMAGVRQGKTYTRGSRGVSGGKTSSKRGVRKGILLEARRRTLAIRENAPANIDPRDLIRKTVRDPETGWKEVVIQKSTGRQVADLGATERLKGGAIIKPDRRALNGVPLKKGEGAIPQIATSQNGAPVRQFERAKDLGPVDRKIEDKAFKKIEGKEAEILSDYEAKNGKVINADSFRPYFKEEGYAGHNAAAVQEPSSYLAKRAFSEGLKKDGEFATFYAGGSGTGKTSAVKNIPEINQIIKDSSVVLDGNLSSFGSAIKKIEEAANAGKKTPIVYVYREPVEAFENGVVKRMLHNKEEMGRLVPAKVVANNHIGSWDVVRQLHKEGYPVKFIDNSLGAGKAKLVSFEDLEKKIRYPSEAQLSAKFDKKAEELYKYGEITAEQYRGYTGKNPPKVRGGASLWQQPWWKEKATKIREVIQDNWIRVKKLQENPNVKVDPKKLTPYEAEILFHGRVGHRLEQATDTLRSIDKEIADAEKLLKNPNTRGDIDRYLVAKHAPERNAIHGEGAAGMTNEEAARIVQDFEARDGSGKLKEIAKRIKETNDQTLDILHEAQVIDDDTYKALRETYKEHVPLNRIFDETEDMGKALVGRGYDVRGSGLKKATGSDREVDDILTNVAANLEQAIVRAEKNRVNLATLEFARENKGLGLFQEIKPRAIGETFDGKPLLERIDDPLVLTVRENGKPVYLKINDEDLATVFKGIGNEKLPPVLNFISGFTRLYSGLATRFNPEFVLSNKLRDLQEMAVYMSSQKKVGFTGAAKSAGRDVASMKDVVDFMRGADTPGAKLYKQMMEDGGTTGGQALSTRKQLKVDIEDIRKLNRAGILNMKQQGKKIVDAFDSWNQVFEDSTRLSVYKTALDRGISRERAAILAKTATINFNKKGTGGPVINALYMFSNASIQGTTKLLTAMKNPKTAAAVTTSVGTSVWAVNSWNDMVDPEWRDKVPEWDRDSNLVVMLPGEEGAKYLTLPVSWGLKPMKVMADYAYDASNGKADQKNGFQVASKVLSSVWDAYNPVGGTDLTSAATPSFLDIPVEIARNQKFSGAKIRPEDKAGVPASENYFHNKEGVPSDKSMLFGALQKGTKAIAGATGGNIQINPANLKYALEGYISGAGRSFTGFTETLGAFAHGELPQASDTPFARRFYKNKTEEEIAKAQKFDAKDELYNKLNSVPKEEQAPIIQEYLNSLPADQRKGAAYGLFQDGFSTKGTTSSDDVIRMRPLVDKINKLEDEGKYDEVDQIIENLSPEDLKSFKNAAKSIKSKASKDLTTQLKPKLDPVVDQILELENSGKYDESDQLFYSLSEDEQKVVQKLIKQR